MRTLSFTFLAMLATPALLAQQFMLNESGYYNLEGVDVMALALSIALHNLETSGLLLTKVKVLIK